MKAIALFSILFFGIFSTVQAQDKELLLKIDEPWRNEKLSFPIHFAPSLDYKGIEEVRFAKGWGNKESEEFWTYAFLWYLDEDPLLTETKLENDIQAYFNGIMNLVGKGRGLTDIPDSKVDFIKLATGSTTSGKRNDSRTNYEGKAEIFDVFFTKSTQILNITAVSDYCSASKKYTVLFTFSPQDRDHSIWKTLNGISLTQDCD